MEKYREKIARGASAWLAFCVQFLVVARAWAQQDSGAAGIQQEVGPLKVAERGGGLPSWQEVLDAVLDLDMFKIALWRVGLAMVLLLLGFSLRGYLLDRLMAPLKTMATRTESKLDDDLLRALRTPLGWVLNLVAVYFALVVLEPPTSVMHVVVLIMQTVGSVLVAWVIFRLIDVGAIAFATAGDGQRRSEMEMQLIPLVVRVLRMVLFVVVAIAIIQQWGYDVTSLIAGLGIGGLAFALAAKPTLENWFGSMMIFSDRPFTVGDWVKTKVGEGVVEDVGLRSTRIRTFDDTLISVPNADIAAGAVENLSVRARRRIVTTIRLVYSTNRQQMDEILAGIKQRITDDERIEDGTWHVYLDNLGTSSLDVLVICWPLTNSYGPFLDIKQALYLDIMQIVERAGTRLALPSQTLYLPEQDLERP